MGKPYGKTRENEDMIDPVGREAVVTREGLHGGGSRVLPGCLFPGPGGGGYTDIHSS